MDPASPAPMAESGAVDPGWRSALAAVVPFVGRWLAVRGRHRWPAIVTIRQIFLSVCGVLVLVVFIAGIAGGVTTEETAGPLWMGVLAVTGVVAIGATHVMRAIPPSAEGPLAGAYLRHVLRRVAVAVLPGVIGFVTTLIVGRADLYLVGLAFAGGALIFAAPTASDIRRVQRRLDAEKRSTPRLADAVYAPPG